MVVKRISDIFPITIVFVGPSLLQNPNAFVPRLICWCSQNAHSYRFRPVYAVPRNGCLCFGSWRYRAKHSVEVVAATVQCAACYESVGGRIIGLEALLA